MSDAKEKKEIGTNIGWQDVLSRVEKNQGVPKKTVQESFTAVEKEIQTIITEIRPKGKEINVIKTPIAAFAFEKVPTHTETDKAGGKWEVSESIRTIITPPNKFLDLANEGFQLTRKRISK